MHIKSSKNRQTGSMLLEALVALLIFSIGILALVGMQGAAIKNVSDAKYRSTAGFLANEMIGAACATRQPVAGLFSYTPDPTLQCNPCNGGNGNSSTKAWITNIIPSSGVVPSLPNACATIVQAPYPAGAATQVTVTVYWTPPNAIAAIPACGSFFAHQHSVSTYIN